MIFRPTPLAGAYVIEPERVEDDRGFFARTFCRKDFEAQGLVSPIAQCNVSFNHLEGTLRGLHFQASPHEEDKLVRCTQGALFDVIVDLRPASETYGQHFTTELTADNRRQLYIPKGFAHGFQTLADNTEVFYQMSTFYAPGFGRGYRYDDSAFNIAWPLPVAKISEKDLALPEFSKGI